jgi:transcriptional regulator with XRE-family HTH domain
MTAEVLPLRRRGEAQTLAQHVVEEVRAAMGRQGISQRRLAKALGINDATLSKRFNGQQELKISFIEQVCILLGLSPGALFNWEPPRTPSTVAPTRCSSPKGSISHLSGHDTLTRQLLPAAA